MSGGNSSWPTMPQSPPEPPASALDNVETKISPSILLIVAILAIVFFVCGLLHLLVRHLLRLRRRRRLRRAREESESVTAFQGQLQQLFHLHDAGVDQAFIDALPVFLYRDVVGDEDTDEEKDGQGKKKKKDPFDCAVCLCEFSGDDELRLLPRCSHAFHVECIDTWLLSHSTCPLCRRSLLADLSSPTSTCSPAGAMVLESDSAARDMVAAAVAARAVTDDDDAVDGEPSAAAGDTPAVPPEEEEVVEVKLGKFKCVEANNNNNGIATAAADGAGTSGGGGDGDGEDKENEGLGQRRCHSMGSYEYVMDDRASLRVAIKPPPKKKPAAASKSSRRRGAMSECEFGASRRRGETSLRLPFPAPATATATAKLAKDSFSVSKTWMVPPPPPSSSKKDANDAAGARRAVSFRWPVSSGGKDEGDGKEGRKSGSEAADWGDVEAGSCGGHSAVSSSLAEERPPSFARRTLLWVVGGRQQSRVGDCP